MVYWILDWIIGIFTERGLRSSAPSSAARRASQRAWDGLPTRKIRGERSRYGSVCLGTILLLITGEAVPRGGSKGEIKFHLGAPRQLFALLGRPCAMAVDHVCHKVAQKGDKLSGSSEMELYLAFGASPRDGFPGD